MSIRMRSGPTFPRSQQPSSDGKRTRIARIAVTSTIATTMLTGCMVGDADEAQRGMLQDAQRTSIVDDLQATESARLLAPSTPDATATADP
ncbi:hypothetical protein BH23CHL3_BH23CHL3_07730 [soil metagenome]